MRTTALLIALGLIAGSGGCGGFGGGETCLDRCALCSADTDCCNNNGGLGPVRCLEMGDASRRCAQDVLFCGGGGGGGANPP